MPEKENKKRIERGEETKKPSLWSRIKKPLLTGVMAAGLLITPMKKAEALYTEYGAGLPEVILKTPLRDLSPGWRYLVFAQKLQRKRLPAREYNDKAIEWFTAEYNRLKIELEGEKNYEKKKEIEHQLLYSGLGLYYGYYGKGLDGNTIRESYDYFITALNQVKEINKIKPTVFGITSEAGIYINLIEFFLKDQEFKSQKDKIKEFYDALKSIPVSYEKTFDNKKAEELIKKYLEIAEKLMKSN